MSIDRNAVRWNGWGWIRHDEPAAKSEALWRFLADALGARELAVTPPVPLEKARLAPPRLSFGEAGALAAVAPLSHDARDRAFHARGRSYRDLLDLRDGALDPAPDVVAYPRDGDAAQRLVELAAREGLAIVPFGGGTSVVGGVTPRDGGKRAVLAVDTTKLDRLLSVDRDSMRATAESGIYGPALENKLQAHGVTLSHFPQSFEFSTLGGWIAARGAGQQSNRYGKAEHWLVSARLATPAGPWATEDFPASSAGPRLTDLVAGSEGTLGLIAQATFVVHEKPMARDYRAYLFRSFADGLAAVREIAQSDAPVATLRLSDEDETRFYGALSRLGGPPKLKHRIEDAYLRARGLSGPRCALIAGVEGEVELVAYARARIAKAVAANGGIAAGESPAKRWFAGRFHGPYLRDPMMDRGLGVDTLETATHWSNVPALHAKLRAALDGAMREAAAPANGIVLAHVSHSYRDGASLYFTYVWPRAATREAAVAEWERIKAAATDAIVAGGGTISHHHGVGTDHAPWMAREKDARSIEALRALKRSLDPAGIMNPGKLGL